MQTSAPERTGSVQEALAHAQRLLKPSPSLALEQALEILKFDPKQADARFIVGLAHAHLGDHEQAAIALRRAAELAPQGPAWRALGDQLTLLGDTAGADAAYAQSIRASVRDPALMQAAIALCDGKLAVCEHLLRPHLRENPTDVAAIRMLAEVGARLGRFDDAEKLLARCLQLAPSFMPARHNYAIVLHRQSKAVEALREIDILLQADPLNPSYRFLRASALTRVGEYDDAIGIYQDILRQYPDNARAWLSLGHACKTAGRRAESIEAYERCVKAAPNFGEGYWSLANMKTYTFDDAALANIEAQVARQDISDKEIVAGRFTLGYIGSDVWNLQFTADSIDDASAVRGAKMLAANRFAPTVLPLDDRYDVRNGMPNVNDTTMEGYGLTFNYKINDDWSFKSVTAQRQSDTETNIDFDTLPNIIADVKAFYGDEQFSQEFQVNYDNGGNFTGVGGIYYFNAEAGGTVLNNFFNLSFGNTNGQVDTDSIAFYGEGTYHFNEQWALTLGGRWTSEDKAVDIFNQTFTDATFTVPRATVSDLEVEVGDDNFSPKISFDYQSTEDTLLYGLSSRAFKSVGFIIRVYLSVAPASW